MAAVVKMNKKGDDHDFQDMFHDHKDYDDDVDEHDDDDHGLQV